VTGGTLALGCSFAALCILLGIMIGWPIGHWRGMRHAAEDAEDAEHAATIAEWKGLADATPDPAPLPVQPVVRAGPGKHRHPAGPRHAELPAAGYLPAEPSPWAGTMTLPAPVQSPPWDPQAPEPPPWWNRPPHTRPPEPEPQTEVLEPTAVLPPPDPLTESAWTRRMALDMDAWIAEHIGATDATLKAITR
jgi:hypothetical protein